MATVIDLVAADRLFKLDPALEDNEQEWRLIYGLPKLLPTLQTALPTWKSHWRIEESPTQQFDALLEVFCSGDTLTFDRRFKPLITHVKDGIWELKTPDLRIFGWFHVKDCFIASAMDQTFNVKSYDLYAGYANESVYHRNQLDLDEPKFVPGGDPNVVVSNYDYP